jgi:hypothetical protein
VWYHCGSCGHDLAPRDAELGVAGVSMSPGLAAMNDMAAAAMPFARAAASRERASLIARRKLVPLPPSPLAKPVQMPGQDPAAAGLVGSGQDGLDVRDGHSHVAEASG